MTLEIKNLSVEIENKKILENLNMKFEKGKVYALMGKNGSGKSTLANTIMGNPKNYVSSGKIILKSGDITNLAPNERAKKGIFLSFQSSQEIDGVTIYDFLRTLNKSLPGKKTSVFEFRRILRDKLKELGLSEDFSERYLNKGFSGGEKKKSEILQMLVLNPDIIILDEPDSGLDVDALQTISKAINNMKKENKIILIITHYKRIFNYINPDKVFVLSEGKLKSEGNKELIDKIDEKGYGILENDSKISGKNN